ncbi:MAG: peptide chain release factor N(5)-glutamine methyltransferase [Deltaproteobacteria bacterium]|nr:peptide chain release factor N(5)-glutamine methyltransferase [Deltaproteobacteria bacterium]
MSLGPLKTLLGVLERAEVFFQERLELDRSAARLDAQVLLAHVLGCDRLQLYIQHDRPLVEDELSAYRELVRRRAMHEPVAYLLGQREFWSLPIKVDARVLIPRPDSESIVELALELMRGRAPSRFADVGTGSGALACALAQEFQAARGVALDLDEAALDLARENLKALGFAERIEARHGDLLSVLKEPVDLLVANLPYISTEELEQLDLDVRGFEPMQALDGGKDGLEIIRRMVLGLDRVLVPGAWALLEVGAGQAEAVEKIMLQAGLGEIRRQKDLGGIERVVAARLPEG